MQEPLVTISLKEYNELLKLKEEGKVPIIVADTKSEQLCFAKNIDSKNIKLLDALDKFISKNSTNAFINPRF